MTPPENPERRAGGGPAAGGSGTDTPPPWQRLTREDGDTHSSGELPADDAAYPDRATPPSEAEQTIVGGSAALFGGHGDNGATRTIAHEESHRGAAPAGERERETVSVANAGARGRSAPSALRRPGRGPRRASLQIKRFDPWSVLKLALVLGVAMFFVWLVAVGVLYTVLDGMGVWEKLNGTYSSLVSGEGAGAPVEPLISAGRVFGIAAILGAINIVLISALATVMAFIYNVSADLAGGLEVTLSERE
ncbi:hypothetical protein CFN78_13660 [Amycolatopsis antarctica]|uniref:DUF3566 domain-containing protein n=1 Tax=Amycolatopsis antarctica TaxID=1854586 RepID=A0A263D2H3_9PSEU|nr:DUF3566 domain-containing protein [Amycolatopsis antarctica]OZM72672.1 hypothetical protein CFN78_13660 [Amycolatopsis antarctica]